MNVSRRDVPRPAFVGIGAPKTGTTWIWAMLRQHPGVFVPEEKELNYFNEQDFEVDPIPNPRANQAVEWYLNFFQGAAPHQVCGEITPNYFWNASAAGRIHAFDPEIKLVAALRDPVERLLSAYLFAVQRGLIPPGHSFEQTIDDRPELLDRTMYGACLARYLDLFPREQLHVVVYDDIHRDPATVLAHIEHFVAVEMFVPDSAHRASNVSGQPAYPRATRILRQSRSLAARHRLDRLVRAAERVGLKRVYNHLRRVRPFDERPFLAPETESRLRERYTPDLERLESLLSMDFVDWKVAGLPRADTG